MQSVVGVFPSPGAACRALEEVQDTVAGERVTVLMPDTPGLEIERRVHSEPGEAPGMGAALGSVIGGAAGLSAAALVLPGVGPVVVAGLLAAGVAGAAGGAAIGNNVEERLSEGLSREELAFYQTELRRGRSVAIAFADDDAQAAALRDAFTAAGAESVY